MTERKSCYGDMFPDMSRPFGVETRIGVVFSASRAGGGLTTPPIELTRDLDAWNCCENCVDFAACYQLSMATLSLQTAANGA